MKKRALLVMMLVLVFAFAVGCGKKPEPATDLTQTEPGLGEAETDSADEAAGEMSRFDDLFGKTAEKEEEQIEEPPPPPPVIKLEDIRFDFDKFTLSAESRRILAGTARTLKENPELRVQIEGHCDDRGTQEYNLALGQRRAQVAKNYIVNFGIDPGRITIISYGEERPLDPASNEEAWAENRRAHFNKR